MNQAIGDKNAHEETVAGFGDEWRRFDQSALRPEERNAIWAEYFGIFPEDYLDDEKRGADFGVGSGRWAAVIAPKVKELICVDASDEALEVAKANLLGCGSCTFVHRTINDSGIEPESLDFAYSLGVLHHIPDTRQAMQACVDSLKPGAPFLVYLYYRFDNKPRWYAKLWAVTEVARRIVSRTPHGLRYAVSQVIAVAVYWPLARFARLAELVGLGIGNFPLTYYRTKSLYVMRTDALDRFGTQLEQRFTKSEIEEMMLGCGLKNIAFSDHTPFWCALGWKRES